MIDALKIIFVAYFYIIFSKFVRSSFSKKNLTMFVDNVNSALNLFLLLLDGGTGPEQEAFGHHLSMCFALQFIDFPLQSY